MENKKKRKSNIELLRIISMFMIVLWHVIKNNVNFTQTTIGNQLLLLIIIVISVVHVNSFVMITGYFSNNQKSTWKKVLSLVGKTWIYKVIIAMILFLSGTTVLTRYDLIKEFFPLDLAQSYWFINRFCVLLLLIPFINSYINRIEEKEFRKLLLVLFILFSFLPLITFQKTVKNDGFGIIHFVYIYLIGAYLSKYPIYENYYFKKFSQNKLQVFLIVTFFTCAFFSLSIYYLSLHLMSSNNELIYEIGSLFNVSIYNYSSPLIIFQSIVYFLFFETLSVNNKSINTISSLTFGIYLFHENLYLKTIMNELLNVKSFFYSKKLVPYIILASIIIFIIGAIVEAFRQYIALKIKRIKILQKIKEKTYNYIEQI